MNEQIVYLCSIIRNLEYTDEFQQYRTIYRKLQNDDIYLNYLELLKNKEYKDEEYYKLKKEVASYQVELKKYENIINLEVEKIVKNYKDLVEDKHE